MCVRYRVANCLTGHHPLVQVHVRCMSGAGAGGASRHVTGTGQTFAVNVHGVAVRIAINTARLGLLLHVPSAVLHVCMYRTVRPPVPAKTDTPTTVARSQRRQQSPISTALERGLPVSSAMHLPKHHLSSAPSFPSSASRAVKR